MQTNRLIPIIRAKKFFDKMISQKAYFILRISDLSEIGLTSDRVPKDQLQLEEVDWAGFVKIIDAYPKMNTYQRIILDKFL